MWMWLDNSKSIKQNTITRTPKQKDFRQFHDIMCKRFSRMNIENRSRNTLQYKNPFYLV